MRTSTSFCIRTMRIYNHIRKKSPEGATITNTSKETGVEKKSTKPILNMLEQLQLITRTTNRRGFTIYKEQE